MTVLRNRLFNFLPDYLVSCLPFETSAGTQKAQICLADDITRLQNLWFLLFYPRVIVNLNLSRRHVIARLITSGFPIITRSIFERSLSILEYTSLNSITDLHFYQVKMIKENRTNKERHV